MMTKTIFIKFFENKETVESKLFYLHKTGFLDKI